MPSDPEPTLPHDASPHADDAKDVHELALDLNFVPTWARKPAEGNPYEHFQGGREGGRRREERSGERRGPRDERGGPRKPRSDGDRRPPRGGGREGQGPGQGPAPTFQPASRPPYQERREFRYEQRPVQLPIEVSFIPERNRLGGVVRQLHTSMRAYPLPFLAGLFLSKPDHHLIKLEVRGGRDLKLYQCREDGVVFLDPEALNSYILRSHLETYFTAEDVQVEPPAGNFVVVGRCRHSGVLLGPPNYHGFNERLSELHRTRFSNMSLDAYRGSIEMVRDPAVIEQWKEQSRSQRVYKAKDGGEAAPALKRAEAEALLAGKIAPKLVVAGTRATMPAAAVAKLEDQELKRLIHEAWNREDRFPLKLMLALRPAFKRMRLHVFKAGRESFVTAIPPKALDASHVVENIRQILSILQEHPGWTRQQLADMLCPGAAMESPEVTTALAPLRWLIEKGHVIEFFNGTLSVPGHERRKQTPPASEPAAPVAEPTPAPAKSPEADSSTSSGS